ncbi:PREDICTED: retinoic acid receptor responder protein 2 [Condylura cristata]|uniref:retinoic acid receptor responder protein 2 n=1 Tax=Condylura cristata TaxID=143302 RepID=UPI000643BCBE|nr:PREDICTED: retinoic acid receptor responder protein 2 [Condylura cristata]
MWQLLLPLALWLGAAGWGRAELTDPQRRGLQVALEEFHKHNSVQWAFRETGVDKATDTPSPAGTFVRLEFQLQQTSCRRKDWKKAECKLKPNGVSASAARQEPGERPEACRRVQQTGEDSHSYYFPGQFAFFKALPPS